MCQVLVTRVPHVASKETLDAQARSGPDYYEAPGSQYFVSLAKNSFYIHAMVGGWCFGKVAFCWFSNFCCFEFLSITVAFCSSQHCVVRFLCSGML